MEEFYGWQEPVGTNMPIFVNILQKLVGNSQVDEWQEFSPNIVQELNSWWVFLRPVLTQEDTAYLKLTAKLAYQKEGCLNLGLTANVTWF